MTLIAHVSDTHFDGSAASADRARRVAGYLAAMDPVPDAVVHTGDVADRGRQEEYAQAAGFFGVLRDAGIGALGAVPGNHDDRAAFRAGLAAACSGTAPLSPERAQRAPAAGRPGEEDGAAPAGSPPLAGVLDVPGDPGAAVVLADVSVPGKPWGAFTAESLERLDADLSAARPGAYLAVALHHHPVDLGIAYVDEIRLRGEERFAAVLDRHPRVAAVLCGHAHTPAATRFAGLPLLAAPSVAPPIRMEREPAWSPEGLDAPPPMLALHGIAFDGRVTTHVRAA
ncbi:metallophosphoesterase [Nocardiopsis coralliicola]